MNYDHTITLRLPMALYDIASKIGRAFDPDSGGAASFRRDAVGYENELPVYADTISTRAPCTAAFYAQAQVMLSDPAMLHAAVSQDYATRWPDLTPPTLAECESFISGIIPEPVLPIGEPT